MKRIVLLLGCLVLMPSGTRAGEFYRWVDAKGAVHYGDVPAVDATQIEVRKFSEVAAPGEDFPYETRRAQQDFPVVLYVAENCNEPCTLARNLLSKRGIPFRENLLLMKEDIDAFKALSGSDSAPTLAVGKTFVKGFQAEQWHSELDIAGYPKTAPYRVPGALSASAPAAASQVAPASPAAQ